MVVIAMVAVIAALAAGPFAAWYRKGRLDESAGRLHETFKWAQTQAMKRGGVEMTGSTLIKKRMYVALNQTSGSYQVVQWRDVDSDGVKDEAEFTVLNSGSLGNARFGIISSVTKTACSNSSSLSGTNPVRNFLSCPSDVAMLANQLCVRFDDKGFLSESLNYAAVYLRNDIDSYAIALNPAGIITLCRWSGSQWEFIR